MVALRTIEDHISTNELSLTNIDITKNMTRNVKQANWPYRVLSDQRNEKGDNQEAMKRKIIENELKAGKTKYQKLQSEIDLLICKADALNLRPEERNNFPLLSPSHEKKKKREILSIENF